MNGRAVAAETAGRTREALRRFHEEEALRSSYDARLVLRLFAFIRPHAGLLVLSLALLLVNACLALVRPLIMRGALDSFQTPDGAQTLLFAGCTLAALVVLEQAIAFPQMYAMQVAGARSMADLRAHLFRFLHERPLSFFDRTPIGRLVTRVTNDVDAVNETFASGALNAVGDCVRLVGIVALLLALDWELSLIAFAAVPPVALGVEWTRRRLRDLYRQIRVKTARLNAFLNEQVQGMAVVQAFARERSSAAEFDEINRAYRDQNHRSIALDASLDAAIELVGSLCVALVLWHVGGHALSERTSFGTLFAFVAYIEMFFTPIRDLSARYTLLQSALAGAERIFQLLDHEERDAPPPADAPRHGSSDRVFELEGVTFSYKPGSRVLADVSLSARRGERVALVGATGSGKTTIASLLLRLYDAQEGTVRVLGRDVRAFERQELRRSFAVVPQDVFLFPGSVATNIAVGEPAPDRERVREALRRIDALDLFERREGGLDAPVLERGANFSAGERQLLAFARALYRDPPMLILDEATANIDSDTEARLQRAVEAALAGRTSLVIAHRLSTIRAADRIVVLHRGHVVEQGSHDELLARGGLYAKLHQIQFGSSPPRPGAAR